MHLPENLIFAWAHIPSIWIFIFFGTLYSLFVFWYEGKKDGFDVEKLFDLSFLLILINTLSYRYINYFYEHLRIYYFDSFLLKLNVNYAIVGFSLLTSLLLTFILSKVWRWSVYRIIDILSVALVFWFAIVFAGNWIIKGNIYYLILALLLIGFYSIFMKYRGYGFYSGFIFSAFLVFVSLLTVLFFKQSGYLILLVLLVTISIGNLYFRNKRMAIKNYLPIDFINNVKNKLMKKDIELTKQEKLLTEEDAYLQPGRADGNSEIMDEAILEDTRKEITDATMGSIKTLKNQIVKALSFMKAGKYGICEMCGQPIDKARLEIYPEATKCIKCASKAEN